MHNFLVSAAAFIVLIGVMVVVHELGHFVVAKLCNVRVEAFSFGFGPRLFGFRIGETDYKVCLLPLGGFVKMTGETESGLTGSPSEMDGDAAANNPRAFTARPRWQRMLIGLAGPFFNFLLTLGLMWFYFAFINEVPSVTVKTTTVEWVTPGSDAATAGLETGDVIVSFDNVKNPDWEGVYDHARLNANLTVPVAVDRGGKTILMSLFVPSSAKSDSFDLSDMGISPQFLPGPIAVAEVQPGMPAAQAGLQNGDAIEAVDRNAFHSVNTLLAYMQAGKGKPITLTVLRNGATLQIVATPEKLDTRYMLGFSTTPTPIRDEPLSLVSAAGKSVGFFRDNALLVGEVLDRLFTHRLSVTQMRARWELPRRPAKQRKWTAGTQNSVWLRRSACNWECSTCFPSPSSMEG